MFKPNATMITMTADDGTMNVISWNHDFHEFAYDFSTGIPLNLLIIYGKDPNFNMFCCPKLLIMPVSNNQSD